MQYDKERAEQAAQVAIGRTGSIGYDILGESHPNEAKQIEDRLAIIANNMEVTANRLNDFLTRWHGAMPPHVGDGREMGSAMAAQPVGASTRIAAQIERLNALTDRINGYLASLESIA